MASAGGARFHGSGTIKTRPGRIPRLTWDWIGWLRENAWVTSWIVVAITGAVGSVDLYVFLRVIWPVFGKTAPEDRHYLGRQIARQSRENREADEAKAAAEARIETRRRVLSNSFPYTPRAPSNTSTERNSSH